MRLPCGQKLISERDDQDLFVSIAANRVLAVRAVVKQVVLHYV